jgi:hypothetical protein
MTFRLCTRSKVTPGLYIGEDVLLSPCDIRQVDRCYYNNEWRSHNIGGWSIHTERYAIRVSLFITTLVLPSSQSESFRLFECDGVGISWSYRMIFSTWKGSPNHFISVYFYSSSSFHCLSLISFIIAGMLDSSTHACITSFLYLISLGTKGLSKHY